MDFYSDKHDFWGFSGLAMVKNLYLEATIFTLVAILSKIELFYVELGLVAIFNFGPQNHYMSLDYFMQ